jgi:opacity protein-like surface antigen
MKKLYITAIAVLLMSATPSYAGGMSKFTDDLQFGAGIGFVDIGLLDSATLFYGIAEKEVDVKLGDTTNTVQLRLGTSTDATSGTYATASIDYLISGLFKSTLKLKKKPMSVYGLLGFSYASITSTTTIPFFGGTVSSSATDSSLSYGIGVDYKIDRDLKVAAEYTAYWSNRTAFAVNAYYNF